jgi:hypothetical protein
MRNNFSQMSSNSQFFYHQESLDFIDNRGAAIWLMKVSIVLFVGKKSLEMNMTAMMACVGNAGTTS